MFRPRKPWRKFSRAFGVSETISLKRKVSSVLKRLRPSHLFANISALVHNDRLLEFLISYFASATSIAFSLNYLRLRDTINAIRFRLRTSGELHCWVVETDRAESDTRSFHTLVSLANTISLFFKLKDRAWLRDITRWNYNQYSVCI